LSTENSGGVDVSSGLHFGSIWRITFS